MEISYPEEALMVTGPSRLVPLTVRVWLAEATFCFVEKPVRLVGLTLMVGAGFTVTLTLMEAVVKFPESVGVKVTLWLPVATGAVEGVVKAKVPGTLAAPPERVELERVWPTRIGVAVGGVVMVGVPLAILKVKEALPESVALLVAVMTMVEFPAAAGVPVMAPVEAFRVKPAGSDGLVEKMFGPLVAEILAEKT